MASEWKWTREMISHVDMIKVGTSPLGVELKTKSSEFYGNDEGLVMFVSGEGNAKDIVKEVAKIFSICTKTEYMKEGGAIELREHHVHAM